MQANSAMSTTKIGANAHRLATIVCCLRDDIAAHNRQCQLPADSDIRAWVNDNYYPGLLELTWEEAVLSVLFRMQRVNASTQRYDFAKTALAQFRRATQQRQIWRISGST
jgi:hypothetical protein